MQIKKEQLEPTKVKLIITAEQSELDNIRQAVLETLSRNVKVPGFRAGKAPANLVEKHLDQVALQSEFIDRAVNQFYVDAVEKERLRPVAPPQINLTKFVPYSTLEFNAEFEAVGAIKLPDYKKIKLAPKTVNVTAKDVNEVLESLRSRGADKKTVKRAAKAGDEVIIDFKGTDAKTGEAISGADGQDYPLTLGSKTFIPGFEEQLIDLKADDKKEFKLTFPENYNVKSLQKRQVKFAVTLKEVKELTKPKLDDKFAASVGPFKNLAELKADIKKQLTAEHQRETQQQFDDELLTKITAQSNVDIPPALVEEEMNRIEEEEKRNLVYRGQTWQEHLTEEGVSAEEHRERQREGATMRVKAGLILGEISIEEGISVTPEELEVRVMLLKNQYADAAMQAELDKPENRRDIHSRLMTEKTLDKLRAYATA